MAAAEARLGGSDGTNAICVDFDVDFDVDVDLDGNGDVEVDNAL